MRQLAIALIGFSLVAALNTASAEPARERSLEAWLLHRQLPFRDMRSYSRAQKRWLPLPSSSPRVRVVNLWARTCLPCLAELPTLRKLAEDWKPRSRDVQFLFVADPPSETSEKEVVDFWTRPFADGLAARCPGQPMRHDGVDSCLLELPDTDPVRSGSQLVGQALEKTETRPLTLLVDERGIIRQVFVGAVSGGGSDRLLLDGAIQRLLHATQSAQLGR